MADKLPPNASLHNAMNHAMVGVHKLLSSDQLTDAERATIDKAYLLLMDAQAAYDYRTGAFEAWWKFYMPGRPTPIYADRKPERDCNDQD